MPDEEGFVMCDMCTRVVGGNEVLHGVRGFDNLCLRCHDTLIAIDEGIVDVPFDEEDIEERSADMK